MEKQQSMFYVKPFDGTSFSNWEFRIKLLLEQQGVLNVLTETPPDPNNTAEYEKFTKSDVKARVVLIQCVADNILEMLKNKKTAKEVIDTLSNTYAKKGISTQVVLQRKLRGLKFMENTTLNEFLTEFEQTICEIKGAGGTVDESEMILQLLSAMPESFQSVTTAIDIMFCQNQSAVTLEFVKNKLLMEEARQDKTREESDPNMAFVGFKGKRGRSGYSRGVGAGMSRSMQSSGSNFSFRCHLCNKEGHKRFECPQRRPNNYEGNQGGYRGGYSGYRGSNTGYRGSNTGYRGGNPGYRGGYRGDRGNFNSSNYDRNGHNAQNTENIEENMEDEDNAISFLSTFQEISECHNNPSAMSTTEIIVKFVVDSGATNHLVGQDVGNNIQNGRRVCQKINVAKQGETLEAKIEGDLCLKTNSGKPIKMKNVWVCENLLYNLLSVKKLEQSGLEVIFKDGRVSVLKNSVELFGGILNGNLYVVSFYWNVEGQSAILTRDNDMLMHRKMGHASRFPAPGLCEVCLQGKQTRLKFMQEVDEDKKAKRILDIVSSDICGPINPATYDGKRYYISFIDHYSHFCVCYLIENKSEALEKFRNYVSMVEAKFNMKISKLRCDNGGEYTSRDFQNFCKIKGILIQYTVAYNPEQNGVAERFNRSIMEKARCLMFDSQLEKYLWGEAVLTSIYLINRTITRALNDNITPAEIWHGEKPDFRKIKLFGCTAYNLVPKELRKSKLDSHCEKLIMIGYANNGYRLWNPNQSKVVHGRNVVFEESEESKQSKVYIDNNPDHQENNKKETEKEKADEKEEEEILEMTGKLGKLEQTNEKTNIRSSRNRQLPRRLLDYDLENDEFNLFTALSTGSLLDEMPQTYADAVKMDKGWRNAVSEELAVLDECNTWELVVPPENVEIIDSRWVFCEKVVDGKVKKKARLVARGFKQSAFSEDVYAPVARMASIRILLSLFVECNLYVIQLDVKSAFLNGTLKNPVFMQPPEGLEVNNINLVCKLKKALYGLRQAPKCWNSLFNEYLINLGFQRSKKDPCLYFCDRTFLLIHVDDLIIFSESQENLDSIKTNLTKRFKMRELGNMKKINFLGMEIEKRGDAVYIKQTDLINKVLCKFNMDNCKPHDLPMQPKLQLKNTNDTSDKNLPYKELIGSLMYIMLGSRPDLSFSVNYFSQFQNCFDVEHWNHLKHILRYLKQTKDYGLKFLKSRDSNVQLSAYVDADFANDITDRKSVSGFVVKMNMNVIDWKTKKQSLVALSSAESEYIALSSCISECLFLGQLCSEILRSNIFPIYVYEDNQACIRMASTLESRRTKHIDLRHYFVRDCVNQQKIVLEYLSTNDQPADMLTKALTSTKFKMFRESLNIVNTIC